MPGLPPRTLNQSLAVATIQAEADICQQLQGLSAGQRRLERKIVRHVRREAMAAAAADSSPKMTKQQADRGPSKSIG